MSVRVDDETELEVWPDGDDVAQWLAALEARVSLLERERADAIEYLAASRRAAEQMAASPTPENLQQVALLMHGRVLPIVEPAPPSQTLIEAAARYRPMTAKERLDDEVEAGMARARRDAAEHRRRIALAERHTGVPYEGVSLREILPRD